MSTSTYTAEYTRTHTATFLADLIMGAFTDIVASLGLSPSQLWSNRRQDEDALTTWIEEGSLKSVVLECHQPNGVVSPIIEIEVEYRAGGEGDAAFVADRARAARFRAKFRTAPVGTYCSVIVCYYFTPTPQTGWVSATRTSTSGMRALTFGTLGAGPHGRATMRYFSR